MLTSSCISRGGFDSPVRDQGRTVNLHLAVPNDGLDETLLLEVVKALPRERTVDLHAVDEGGDGHEPVRLDILVEPLRGGLVENDGVLGLVLDLALGPRGIACELLAARTAATAAHERRVLSRRTTSSFAS